MLPKWHILIGAILSFLIVLIFPSFGLQGFLIIFFSSFLIDIDHFFYYIYKKKKLNPLRAYNWYKENCKKFKRLSRKQRKKVHGGNFLFHGIEFLILLFFFGVFISKFFFFIFLGFFLHLFLDLFSEIHFRKRIDKISFFYNIFRFRKLKFIEEI